MNVIEIFIGAVLIIFSAIYIICYILKPFKRTGNPCGGCPYSSGCGKKIKCVEVGKSAEGLKILP